MTIRALVFVWVLALTPSAVTGTATISGVVRSADSAGTPVRLARVMLTSAEGGAHSETATTDGQGRFTFRRLPAGRYTIRATKRAWLDANFGASRLGRPGVPIAIKDGQVVADLQIRMTRGAVIAGHIRDENGEPQPGVQVRVLRFVTSNGNRALERPTGGNMNDPITDDEGAYRFFGLSPGEYLVVASLRLSQSSGLGGTELRTGASDAKQPSTNAPIFFPGTTDMSAASTIRLGAGEERLGVNIPFQYLPAAKVTGTVTMATGLPPPVAGERSRNAECRMTPEGFEDLLREPLAASVASVPADGRIIFSGVPPGRYTVVCAAGAPSGSGGPNLLGWGETSVVVSGEDQHITLVLGPAGSLGGRVVFEGTTPPPADLAVAINVTRRGFGKARLLRPDFDTSPRNDSTFLFRDVVSGLQVISATPRGAVGNVWSLKSVKQGDRDLHDQPLTVATSDEISDIVITFTDKPSELAGRLEDASGRPVTDFFIIAFTTERGRWTPTTRRIQTTRPGSDGAFSIKALPAGEYFLAALTDVEPGEWLSPAFLDQIVPAAVKVSITDGAKTTQSLRVR